MVWLVKTTGNRTLKVAALAIALLACARGWIERIEEDLVVIADVLRPLSPFVTYHSGITGLEASASEFRPGTFVGYRLNSERVIIALWLLEDDGS
ncbi:MAG: hypothetical protein ACYS0I_12945 [Planctomycetota bacterium]|jgi:hypothetical protein